MSADRRALHRDAFLTRAESLAPAHGHSQRDAEFVLRRRAPFRPGRRGRARASDGRRGRGDRRHRRRIDQARPSSGFRGGGASAGGRRCSRRWPASTRPSRSTPPRRRWRARRRGSAPASSTTSGDCSAIPAWRTRSPRPARRSSSCTTATRRIRRSTFSTTSSASSSARSTCAAAAGVPFGRILLDPGVGFGKTPEQNHACIWNLDRFRAPRRPILVGLSRKSFIGRIIGAEVDRRLPGTLAADTIALMRGASVLRVHDVAENREALDVFAGAQARRRAVLAPRSARTTAGRASCSRSAAMSATRS